jgi:hypothetical protein
MEESVKNVKKYVLESVDNYFPKVNIFLPFFLGGGRV